MKGSFEFAWREGGWNLFWAEAMTSGLKRGFFVYRDGIMVAHFSKKDFALDSKKAFRIYAGKARRKKKLAEIKASMAGELEAWDKKFSKARLSKLGLRELNHAFNQFLGSIKKIVPYYTLTEP